MRVCSGAGLKPPCSHVHRASRTLAAAADFLRARVQVRAACTLARRLCCAGARQLAVQWAGGCGSLARSPQPRVLCVAATSRVLRRARRRVWRGWSVPGDGALRLRLRGLSAKPCKLPRKLIAACWLLWSLSRPLTCPTRCCTVARKGFPLCRPPHGTGLPIRMAAPTSPG